MTSTNGLILPAEPDRPTLLKTDVLGRVRRASEQREKILDEFDRSGLSGCKFAELCGVKYQTFATWVQKRKRARNAYPKPKARRKTVPPLRWLEAAVSTSSPSSAEGLLLQLPGGVRAQLAHPSQIALAAALVRALEKPC